MKSIPASPSTHQSKLGRGAAAPAPRQSARVSQEPQPLLACPCALDGDDALGPLASAARKERSMRRAGRAACPLPLLGVVGGSGYRRFVPPCAAGKKRKCGSSRRKGPAHQSRGDAGFEPPSPEETAGGPCALPSPSAQPELLPAAHGLRLTCRPQKATPHRSRCDHVDRSRRTKPEREAAPESPSPHGACAEILQRQRLVLFECGRGRCRATLPSPRNPLLDAHLSLHPGGGVGQKPGLGGWNVALPLPLPPRLKLLYGLQ